MLKGIVVDREMFASRAVDWVWLVHLIHFLELPIGRPAEVHGDDTAKFAWDYTMGVDGLAIVLEIEDWNRTGCFRNSTDLVQVENRLACAMAALWQWEVWCAISGNLECYLGQRMMVECVLQPQKLTGIRAGERMVDP